MADFAIMDVLWRNGLTTVPLAIVVAMVCKWVPTRPATRHSLWLMVLTWSIMPPVPADWRVIDTVATAVSETATDESATDDVAAIRMPKPDHESTAAVTHPVHPIDIDARPKPIRKSSAPVTLGGATTDDASLADQWHDAIPVFKTAPDRSRGATKRRRRTNALTDRTSPRPERSRPRNRDLGRSTTVDQDNDGPSLITAARFDPTAPRTLALGTADRGRPLTDNSPSDRVPRAWDFSRTNETVAVTDTDLSNTDLVNTELEQFPISYAVFADVRNTSNGERSRGPGKAGSPAPAARNPRAGSTIVEQRADPQRGADRSASSKKSFAESLGWPQFAVKLANVRDAVLALPSIPSRIWLGGFIVLVMGCALRVWLFNRRVRSAFAAPQSVVHVVREAAGSIGLRRLPGVFFVHDRIPPMVWGALHPRLFLPVTLWAQLDPVGRRAVICHELAHLRRRDHWLCWADTLIGAIYWWHPVVWWVRHRLHDEAENCCDAWVTHLMPHDRRAYAEALLHAKQYVSTDNVRVPAVGIGVTKGRARRFARRITMVMTKRVAPRLSVWGLALAFLMGGAGWLTSPVWACPPKAKTSTLMVTAPKLIDAGTGNLVIAGIGIGNCSAPCLTKSGCCSDCTGAKCCASKKDKCCAKCNVPVAITVGGGLGCCKDANCAACGAKAKCKLCKAGKNCTKCASATAPCISLGGGVQVFRTVPSGAYAVEVAPVPTIKGGVWSTAPEVVSAFVPAIKSQVWAMATAPEAISTFEQYMAGKDVAGKIAYAAAPAALATWLFDDDEDDDDEDEADDGFESRLHRLEKQMDRLGEHLEKIADRLEGGNRERRGMRAPREPREPREPRSPRGPRPPASWRAPGPFADVFGPESVGGLLWRAPESDETMTRSYELPGNKLEALTALMVLSDVPILVSPNDDHIDVHATARQQEIFEAFVDMIHPSPKKKAKEAKKGKQKKKAKRKGRARGDRPDALIAVYNQHLAGVLHRAGAADAQARAEQQYVGELQRYVTEIAESQNRAALRQYTLAVKQLRSVDRGALIETVKTHAQSLQQRAMELAREAERLLEQAESLEMNADNLSVEAEILRSEASDIEDKDARTQTRRHANLIEKEVRAMAAEARRSNGEANKLENRADRLADAAEVLYDTISEILDRMTEEGAR